MPRSLYQGSTKKCTKCRVAVFFFVIYKYYFGSALTSGRSRPSDKGGPSHLDPEIRWEEGGGLKFFFGPSGLSLVQK